MCEQLAQSRYLTVPRLGVDPGTLRSPVSLITIAPPSHDSSTINVVLRYYFYCYWDEHDFLIVAEIGLLDTIHYCEVYATGGFVTQAHSDDLALTKNKLHM